MLANVFHDRAGLLDRPAKFLPGDAKLLRPIVNFVILFEIDALVVLPSGLLGIVGHGIAPFGKNKQNTGAIHIPKLKALHGVAMHQLARRGGVHLYRVFQRKLDGAAAWPFPEGYEPIALPQAEALSACANGELELSEPTVRAAYAAGGVCVGARHAGALVAYVWFALAAAPHVGGIWVKRRHKRSSAFD